MHPCSYCLRENSEEVPAEISRTSSKVFQYQNFSNTGIRQHVYRMKSYKVTYHLKKKVGEKHGGPIQMSILCSTILEAGLLTNADCLILD
jgi:hypothetical protein